MLPEMPFAFILDGIDVVMGYPIGISVENGVVEITLLEFVGSVKNRLDTVMCLYPFKPRFNGEFEFVGRFPAGGFHIEHGWKVAGGELHGSDKEIGLFGCIRLGKEIMISTTDETIFACLAEVVRKSVISVVTTFRGFHKNKVNGEFRFFVMKQFLPVDASLIVGDVDAVHIETAWQTYSVAFLTVTGLPTVSIRTDEEPIKNSGKDYNNAKCQQITQPDGHGMGMLLFLPTGRRFPLRRFSTGSRRRFDSHALGRKEKELEELGGVKGVRGVIGVKRS